MKCREELLTIRRERQEELHEYSSILSAFSFDSKNLLRRRYNLLTLELPHKTDTLSVNEAWVSDYLLREFENSSERSLSEKEKFNRKVRNRFPERDQKNYKNEENLYQQRCWINKFESLDLKIENISYDSDGRATRELKTISDDDMESSIVRKEVIKEFIKGCRKEGSKRVQTSLCKQFLKRESRSNKVFVQEADIVAAIKFGRVCCSSEMAKLYEYLENRCLLKGKEEYYKNLCETRLLLYVPKGIPTLKTIKLSDIDIRSKVIKVGDEVYSVPETFIRLAKSLYRPTQFIFKSTNDQIFKLVARAVKKADLLKDITPKLIRQCLSHVYFENGLNLDLLPRR
ncbi:hypothetical protein [Simkania negevensis]|uniref:Uncharacterized protein n=1 Tax=Simkania negevensis (strain ATCC VR-1471 / DSM 27360 / Z) TaxID=331113 RepID=F8L8J6_SIMNZ|nr:hypothetical protein [Simkania negevensis]CCB89128.1 unknown protein [Simkania negevensis Z]